MLISSAMILNGVLILFFGRAILTRKDPYLYPITVKLYPVVLDINNDGVSF